MVSAWFYFRHLGEHHAGRSSEMILLVVLQALPALVSESKSIRCLETEEAWCPKARQSLSTYMVPASFSSLQVSVSWMWLFCLSSSCPVWCPIKKVLNRERYTIRSLVCLTLCFVGSPISYSLMSALRILKVMRSSENRQARVPHHDRSFRLFYHSILSCT